MCVSCVLRSIGTLCVFYTFIAHMPCSQPVRNAGVHYAVFCDLLVLEGFGNGLSVRLCALKKTIVPRWFCLSVSGTEHLCVSRHVAKVLLGYVFKFENIKTVPDIRYMKAFKNRMVYLRPGFVCLGYCLRIYASSCIGFLLSTTKVIGMRNFYLHNKDCDFKINLLMFLISLRLYYGTNVCIVMVVKYSTLRVRC